jgi:hypothetical protein
MLANNLIYSFFFILDFCIRECQSILSENDFYYCWTPSESYVYRIIVLLTSDPFGVEQHFHLKFFILNY